MPLLHILKTVKKLINELGNKDNDLIRLNRTDNFYVRRIHLYITKNINYFSITYF